MNPLFNSPPEQVTSAALPGPKPEPMIWSQAFYPLGHSATPIVLSLR